MLLILMAICTWGCSREYEMWSALNLFFSCQFKFIFASVVFFFCFHFVPIYLFCNFRQFLNISYTVILMTSDQKNASILSPLSQKRQCLNSQDTQSPYVIAHKYKCFGSFLWFSLFWDLLHLLIHTHTQFGAKLKPDLSALLLWLKEFDSHINSFEPFDFVESIKKKRYTQFL